MEQEIIAQAMRGMSAEGIPFIGCVYPGIMLTKSGPKVFEYNARPGDPEIQAYLRILDTDIIDIFQACIDGKLSDIDMRWKDIFACNIALASSGYPDKYEKGKLISGIKDAENKKDIVIFHAGTKMEGNKVLTNGGRVLGVSATGVDLKDALSKAYEAISLVSFEGMQYRKDIGKGALGLLE